MPKWMGVGFQDPSTYVMGELMFLHDHIMLIMSLVLFVVIYFFFFLIFNSFFYKFLSESTFVEVVWSVFPSFLLIVLIFPSIKVLYLMEDIKTPSFSFKITGHQWYWSYSVPFFKNLSVSFWGDKIFTYDYDSMMGVTQSGGGFINPRLLGCDADFFLPAQTTSRLLITSMDVIHCFAMPSMGLKVDALPGRINQLYVNPSRVGVYYGECSEICGSNHSFMPIYLKVCGLSDFDGVSKDYLLDFLMESFDVSCLDL